jgi:hypothetical protein
MRIRYVLGSLVGGLVVFVACASQNAATGPGPSPGTDSGAGVVDALLDVLREDLGVEIDTAVKDAEAGPGDPPTTVDEVDCTIGSTAGFYGEKGFPGRSKDDLARGSATVCGGGGFLRPPGYDCTVVGLVVRDGAAAAYCGNVAGAKARIIMPPSL